ncbi:hypothetical protein CC86DRAFT_382897 [Ophiobolus disseminans]|uniref:Uncharacterized protein n=1 Tax=Ophiobolus disseminans TaxID=1469910 RepID=A0A6A6ZYK7_9PLEO|nr:hypothetical protein CC86DRAFT_382897 [Ophiobolus disseminans]
MSRNAYEAEAQSSQKNYSAVTEIHRIDQGRCLLQENSEMAFDGHSSHSRLSESVSERVRDEGKRVSLTTSQNCGRNNVPSEYERTGTRDFCSRIASRASRIMSDFAPMPTSTMLRWVSIATSNSGFTDTDSFSLQKCVIEVSSYLGNVSQLEAMTTSRLRSTH